MSASPPSSKWRWDQLAADMTQPGILDASNEWPHADYALAAQACANSPEDQSKLHTLCDDLESLVAIGTGWASMERISRATVETCAVLRGRCWREILQQNDLAGDVWKSIYRLGSAYRAESMDSATRRTAMILQLAARQKLKSAAGFFENSEESARLESERAQLLTRSYIPNFLRDALS